jgi:protein-S-isoprenylcysteine O-methyltransferase Ste14
LPLRTSRLVQNLAVILLGILFTITLFYLTLELSNILHELLKPIFSGFPSLPVPIPYLQVIGLICFCIILIVIILGFIIKKVTISSVGSFILFMPTFAHFLTAMFLLLGIQVLQIILLPLGISEYNILSFGTIIKLPYIIIEYFASFSLDKYLFVSYFCYGIILIGLMTFSYGLITWFQGVLKKKEINDFSIYKYSRHPQYLGYLIWSYGIYLLTLIPKGWPYGSIQFEYTFIWFLSALIIIGVALYEEILMIEKFPEKFVEYRKKASFLIPMPKKLKSLFTMPIRIVFKKELPENRREILFLLAYYGLLIISISILLNPLLAVH